MLAGYRMTGEIGDLVWEMGEVVSVDAFNPYSQRYAAHDLPEAPSIRGANLMSIMTAAVDQGIDEMWLGLEPSYAGARRTGLAMTDERYLDEHAGRFGATGIQTATSAGRFKEPTACHVWKMLRRLPSHRVFLWNTVFLHTHKPGSPLSNRRQSAEERELCRPFLARMIRLLRPPLIYGIGRDSFEAIIDIGVPRVLVHHPSNGHQNKFRDEMSWLHGDDATASAVNAARDVLEW